jgi:type VI secretion system secreted protein VgrG
MSQPLAGPRYGMHFPLRTGVEVLVTFVDGDPDRPVIQGAMPHSVSPSPVTRTNSLESRIETQSGVSIIMKDS